MSQSPATQNLAARPNHPIRSSLLSRSIEEELKGVRSLLNQPQPTQQLQVTTRHPNDHKHKLLLEQKEAELHMQQDLQKKHELWTKELGLADLETDDLKTLVARKRPKMDRDAGDYCSGDEESGAASSLLSSTLSSYIPSSSAPSTPVRRRAQTDSAIMGQGSPNLSRHTASSLLTETHTSSKLVQQKMTSSPLSLKLFICTWNMKGKLPPQEPLDSLIPVGKFDMYAIGTQECERSIASSLLLPPKHEKWEEKLVQTLGEGYALVRSHNLGSIHLSVFIRTDFLPLVTDVQSAEVSTGLANVLNNKGGVGITCRVGQTSFLFINSHLTAHDKNVEARNADFHRINAEMALFPAAQPNSSTSPPSALTSGSFSSISNATSDTTTTATTTAPNSSTMTTPRTTPRTTPSTNSRTTTPRTTTSGGADSDRVTDRFDRVFWFGDLNYRIIGKRTVIEQLINVSAYEVLVAQDQLTRQKQEGLAFRGFLEGSLVFRPTFKYDEGTDIYDTSEKARVPSWTDRILFKANEHITMHKYDSCDTLMYSDHRAVFSHFDVNFELGPYLSSDSDVQSRVCTIV